MTASYSISILEDFQRKRKIEIWSQVFDKVDVFGVGLLKKIAKKKQKNKISWCISRPKLTRQISF